MSHVPTSPAAKTLQWKNNRCKVWTTQVSQNVSRWQIYLLNCRQENLMIPEESRPWRRRAVGRGWNSGSVVDQWNGFWCFWPVNDATHVDLQLAVVSQQPLLHRNQVHRLVVEAQEAHAALKDVEGIFTLLTVVFSWTTWAGRYGKQRIREEWHHSRNTGSE